jgi:hypothetical protein
MIAPKILFILQTPFSLPFESTIDSSSVRQDGDDSAIGQAISARTICLLLILIDLTLILSAPVLIIALVVAAIVVSVVVLAIIPTIVATIVLTIAVSVIVPAIIPTIVVPVVIPAVIAVVIAAIITLIVPTLIIAVVATIISPVIATIVARLCLVDDPAIPRPVFVDLRRPCDRKAEHERAHCQHDT